MPVQSLTRISEQMMTTTTRKPLHIVDTTFLDGNEVLVSFSDGTAAVYEAEELEKLRPAPKYSMSGLGTDSAQAHASRTENAA